MVFISCCIFLILFAYCRYGIQQDKKENFPLVVLGNKIDVNGGNSQVMCSIRRISISTFALKSVIKAADSQLFICQLNHQGFMEKK
ncbi:hypothetical protein Leryth_017817 [Lithospermum erythrorhizon]|nr:hypothetical protein Leryth_017817 [Lithospermum erythrorhizon]